MTIRITLQDYFKLFLIAILLLPLFTLAGKYPPGEPKIISGLVLSETDQSPVAGASIIVKGSKVGTSSGLDGKFSIKAKEGDVLVITGVGITKQEITIGAESYLSISVGTNSKKPERSRSNGNGHPKRIQKAWLFHPNCRCIQTHTGEGSRSHQCLEGKCGRTGNQHHIRSRTLPGCNYPW